ncbi:MAG: UbiA family prenyltransferase [Acutalibacteraceae bacterium]
MKVLKACNQLFRAGEWYDSKVPMLLLPALYAIVAAQGEYDSGQLKNVIVLMIFFSIFLAFGYLINDYADIEADKKAGKDKIMHRLPKPVPLLLVIGSVILGCLPVLLVSHDWKTIVILCVIYFFGASYSAPPLRFKERGVFGLLVSSTAQRCFPLLLIPLLLQIPVDAGYILWMLLSFFVGIRYILVHQYIDAENDRKAGVQTFALHHKSVAVLIRLSFAAELLMMILLLIPVCMVHRWIIALLSAYALLSVIRWRGCKLVFGHGGLYSFDQVPLEDFYNQYLPLIFIILLMEQNLSWGILLAIWVLVLLRPTIKHLEFPVKILTKSTKVKE